MLGDAVSEAERRTQVRRISPVCNKMRLVSLWAEGRWGETGQQKEGINCQTQTHPQTRQAELSALAKLITLSSCFQRVVCKHCRGQLGKGPHKQDPDRYGRLCSTTVESSNTKNRAVSL